MQKNKKILIIILSIVFVVVAMAVTFLILFFATDIFKNGQQAFAYAIYKNIDTYKSLVNENIISQEEFRKANSYNSEGTINGTITQGSVSQNVQLKTTARNDINKDRYYADITLENAGQDVLKYSFIRCNDIYSIKCDDVLTNYVGIRNSNLKDYARKAGVPESTITNIPDKIDFEAVKGAFNFTVEEKETLEEKYLNVVLSNIPKENFEKAGKENITANNINCNANKYTLHLNGDEIKNLLIRVLDAAKEDEIIMNMLAKLQNALTTNVDTNLITNNIENLMAGIENNETIANTEIEIDLYSYKGNTVKTTVDISSLGKVTIDTDKSAQTITVLLERYDDARNIKVSSRISLNKGKYNDSVIYNIEILPNTLDIGKKANIMIQLGNTTENRI